MPDIHSTFYPSLDRVDLPVFTHTLIIPAKEPRLCWALLLITTSAKQAADPSLARQAALPLHP